MLQGPIPVHFEQVFPHGCYLVGQLEPVRDFDASTKDNPVQARDKVTRELVWQVAVMDGDPTVKAAQKTVSVKIASNDKPAVPPLGPDLPFVPVQFEHMTVTPYVHQATGRLAYSYRAGAIGPVSKGTRATGTTASGAGGAA